MLAYDYPLLAIFSSLMLLSIFVIAGLSLFRSRTAIAGPLPSHRGLGAGGGSVASTPITAASETVSRSARTA
jgi:hypothetical protein